MSDDGENDLMPQGSQVRIDFGSSLVKSLATVMSSSGFFLTPPAEKTKTQGQNSSKKLKKKTQPFGGLSLPYTKLKKTKFVEFSPQNSKLSKGWHFLDH